MFNMIFWNPYKYSVFRVSNKAPDMTILIVTVMAKLGPKMTQIGQRSNPALDTRVTFKNSVFFENILPAERRISW